MSRGSVAVRKRPFSPNSTRAPPMTTRPTVSAAMSQMSSAVGQSWRVRGERKSRAAAKAPRPRTRSAIATSDQEMRTRPFCAPRNGWFQSLKSNVSSVVSANGW